MLIHSVSVYHRLNVLGNLVHSLEEGGGVDMVAPDSLLMLEQDTLVTGADDIHSAQQSAVTLEVALSPFLSGLDNVHPDIGPEEAQHAQPPLLRTKEGFLSVKV